MRRTVLLRLLHSMHRVYFMPAYHCQYDMPTLALALILFCYTLSHVLNDQQVPTASRTAKGVPVPQVLPLAADEKISSVIPVTDFKEDEFVILLTKVSLYSDYTYTYVPDCINFYSYAHAAALMLHELFMPII
jgi:hypothetical protein